MIPEDIKDNDNDEGLLSQERCEVAQEVENGVLDIQKEQHYGFLHGYLLLAGSIRKGSRYGNHKAC
jgi:hypothetical protein